MTEAIDNAGRVELTEVLVRSHQAPLWRYLRALGCAAADAEDLVQEAFLALLRARLHDSSPSGVRAWLRATGKNLFLVRCRRERREPLVLADLDAAFAAYERGDDGQGYREALHSCIAGLPPREREMLQLRYHDDADRARLAAAAGVSPEGAKTLLRRIKLALRNCVNRKLSHGTRTERS